MCLLYLLYFCCHCYDELQQKKTGQFEKRDGLQHRWHQHHMALETLVYNKNQHYQHFYARRMRTGARSTRSNTESMQNGEYEIEHCILQ